MKNKRILTRRDFLGGTVAAAVSLAAGFPVNVRAEAGKKIRVVLIRHPEALDKKGRINPPVIRTMLDEGVAALLGREDPVESWQLLVTPADIVGIKSNEWGPLPTPREVETALKLRIRDAGIHEKNIGIDDRNVLQNEIFLKSTALVNVRPMRTHHWAGVGGCIKNYIMFSPSPPRYHPDSCANLATLWKLPVVKNKTRLNILVLLTPLYHGIGAHHFDMDYTWPYKGILLSRDPVAVDSVGLRILELKRREHFGRHTPLRPSAKHIALADERHKLGTSNPSMIELVKIGWTNDALI